jgi:hypothetical protein
MRRVAGQVYAYFLVGFIKSLAMNSKLCCSLHSGQVIVLVAGMVKEQRFTKDRHDEQIKKAEPGRQIDGG